MSRDRTEEIARGIAESHGQPGLIDALAMLSPSELSSIVMHASRRIAKARDFPQVATQSERTPIFAPSTCDPRAMLEIDRQAFASAAAFEAIDLSPVVPLGAGATTGIDPNSVLAAVRQAEVMSDTTIGQALECARRRRKDRKTAVRLASSQRVLRLQPFDVPGYSPHFRLFTLVSAGRDTGDERFERAELLAHLDAWLHLLAALGAGGLPDQTIGRVRVELSDTRIVRALIEARGVDPSIISEQVRGHQPGSGERLLAEAGVTLPKDADLRQLEKEPAIAPFLPRLAKMKKEVIDPLAARYPETELAFDLARLQALSYYSGPTFKIIFGAEGERMAIGDGGFADWTQRLLSDGKERMLASAMGTELLGRKLAARPKRSAELSVEVLTSGIWKLSSVLLARGRSVWAIDPGYFPRELDAIVERARAHGRVERVVFTHGHWDHVIGWRSFPGAEVLGSPSLAEAVAGSSERAERDLAGAREFDGRWYVDRGAPLEWPRSIRPLSHGARLDVGGTVVEAIHLPGHSPDGLGLLVPERGLLIAGDYLSPEEIPFVDDLAAYRATLAALIALIETIDHVIPGHGAMLDRAAALAIARADLSYLDRLAEAGSPERALEVPLPRAAHVPGMLEHHRENAQLAASQRGA